MSPNLLLALQFAVFAIVATAVLALLRLNARRLTIKRRLEGDDGESNLPRSALLRDEEVRNPVMQVVGSTFLSDPRDRSKLRLDLRQAGFDTPSAPVAYVLIRFSLAIGLPLIFILLNAALHFTSGLGLVMIPLILCGAALVGPRMFINRRAQVRRQSIEYQFPDALDLIMVCIEAGLGLEAAFVRVGRETVESHPQIAHEFNTLADEMTAGRSRADALRGMGERLEIESIKAFVALLVQTETLGVSIASALRTYSAEMRETRMLRAEEKAMRIPVLMTLPLVACFMPVMVVALLLPPAIDLVRTLLPTLRGGR